MTKKTIVFFVSAFLLLVTGCDRKPKADLDLDVSDKIIEIDETYTIQYQVTEGFEVDFSLSKEGIVSISGNTVVGLKEGEVIITATIKGTKVSKTVKITVVKPDIIVESISIAGPNEGLIGTEVTLIATVLPTNATNKDVSWISSDLDLATVENGVVTLLKEGTVTITATADEKEATHIIVITGSVVAVESITILGENNGATGSQITLSTEILPANATNKTITWSSSNSNIATVENGIVTLKEAGIVTIAATIGSISTSHEIVISDPVIRVESVTLTGDSDGFIGDTITLIATITPENATNKDIEWISSDLELATVENGVVTLLKEGTVTISATADEKEATHTIVISKVDVAFVGETGYKSIQEAITAANPKDTITLIQGEINEAVIITKSITLEGASDFGTVLTNKITIESGLSDITIRGFEMTDGFFVHSSGTLDNFQFVDNYVHDTNLPSSGYSPNQRIDVNAIIKLYSLAGTNLFGDIFIVDNIFENIQSDIISISRTMKDKEINIENNRFFNFQVGVIRFDGGYNNGTYNIKENTFKNDIKQAEAAIVFRAYAPEATSTQVINIENNIFENIGNEANNSADSYPASGVIVTSTFNDNSTTLNIGSNTFKNTHNSIHLRKNYSGDLWAAAINANTFENPTGYILYEDGQVSLFTNNIYYDVDGALVNEEDVIEEITDTSKEISLARVPTTYKVRYYTYNESLDEYDLEEETIDSFAGYTAIIIVSPKVGYYTDFDKYQASIKSDGSTVIEIYYELLKFHPDAFPYELELNGGNFEYQDRLALVNDFITDYNTVTGKSNTLENMNMGPWADVDYHLVFFQENYREKWLWMAAYLSQVGSSTNKNSARDVVISSSASEFTSKNANWVYAFSYEVRGFLKGQKYTNNANWQSSDYSDLALANGFWDIYTDYNIAKDYQSEGPEVILPTKVYKDGYNFMGWFDNVDGTGEPITILTETKKVYAIFEEKNPVTEITISNKVDELMKGKTHQLSVAVLPIDAFNKTLLYTTSNGKVASISETGLITALNEGTTTITVTNYNGNVMDSFTITIYPEDDIILEFSEGYNGYILIDDTFTLLVNGFGKTYKTAEYRFQVENDTILEHIGVNQFKALNEGTTQIEVYILDELIYTYPIKVQGELGNDRIDMLLELLANANNAVTTPLNVIPYYTASQEWSDPRYESVNLFLFDDFEVDRTTYLADPVLKSSGLKSSTEFILLHDTANLNGGLINHGNFFKNPANPVSIHYTVGDYGILQTLEDAYIAWHAGDGTSAQFNWIPTGITASDTEKPIIDISVDGYFTFNGVKSSVLAPKGKNNEILDKSYFTYQGPTWDIQDGKYVIGTTWFATGQQARGVIASRGGNNNSIGIEMNVNTNADIIDTVQRTAKLVAHLLEENNLENHKVIMHNTTDGKGDPYTLNNTLYKGTWYFDRFMEHVLVEREVLSNYADAVITLTSTSELISSSGRVIALPEFTTEVEYTITVTIGEQTKSITLISVIPGIHTWSQHYGFFTPMKAWAKADYRN